MLMRNEKLLETLSKHIGHDLVVVTYGDENTALECETCKEVVIDFEGVVR